MKGPQQRKTALEGEQGACLWAEAVGEVEGGNDRGERFGKAWSVARTMSGSWRRVSWEFRGGRLRLAGGRYEGGCGWRGRSFMEATWGCSGCFASGKSRRGRKSVARIRRFFHFTNLLLPAKAPLRHPSEGRRVQADHILNAQHVVMRAWAERTVEHQIAHFQ